MCIRVKNIFPKKAKTDIVCYKLLRSDMTAPITGFQYDLGEYKANGLFSLLKSIINSIVGKLFFTKKVYYDYSIGLIHTYKLLALHFVDLQLNYLHKRLFKCVIPKGTYYYESNDSIEYASRKLKIIKEVPYAEFITNFTNII